ncbi:MAG: glycine--tRNA ligase [Candidatus Saccharimonadales bacterium]
MSQVKLEDIVSLCKRRGFIYQGSEIYGGLAGTWDWGPLGVMLKQNIQNVWWEHFVLSRDDMYPLDSAILMNSKVWQASGHLANFADPLVECKKCKARFRADRFPNKPPTKQNDALWLEKWVDSYRSIHGFSDESDLAKAAQARDESYIEGKVKCPNCSKFSEYVPSKAFNLMFKTSIGPVEGEENEAYLRPETAQGIFTNFKNVVDSFQPDMPFGIAQIGKAFRNEISPRDFIFRDREMEMMEIEYFFNPKTPAAGGWQKVFDYWLDQQAEYLDHIGIDPKKLHKFEHPDKDRSHYSKKTIDWEFDYPFGKKELTGLAYRTDFDLQAHIKHSGKNLAYQPKDGGEAFVPHVLEPTFGIERLVLAVLSSTYAEDEQGGEKRVLLKLPEHIAPIKIAVFPLLKNKPELVKKAREVYTTLKKEIGNVMWDDNGNIGKRYRRQDEIGTPHCITIDFDSLKANDVTIRNRDTTKQERVPLTKLAKLLGG